MPTRSASLKLVPELVPRPLWGRSVNKALPRTAWERDVRAKVKAKAGGVCEDCGASYEKGMICHEDWRYDEQERTATLMSFRLICRDCNFVHHLGKASTLGLEQSAIAHLTRVNNIDQEEAARIVTAATERWFQRSLIEDWTISISGQLIQEFPLLSGLKL